MPKLLFLFLTRYPEETLSQMLFTEDVPRWFCSRISTCPPPIGTKKWSENRVQKTQEGHLFISWNMEWDPPQSAFLPSYLQGIFQTISQALANTPITFYIFLTDPKKDMSVDWDTLLAQYGGPLLWISLDAWDPAWENEFHEWHRDVVLENDRYILVRDPLRIWLDCMNEPVIKPRRSKHKLEYDRHYERRLPVAIAAERKELDLLRSISHGTGEIAPQAVEIHLQTQENAVQAALRAYKDVPIGWREVGRIQLGGRSLLSACNLDANLIAGWRMNEEAFQVHNAASLHLKCSSRRGSLPEALITGRVILRQAWIQGTYVAPPLPEVRPKPRRMVWPQLNSKEKKDVEK